MEKKDGYDPDPDPLLLEEVLFVGGDLACEGMEGRKEVVRQKLKYLHNMGTD